MKIILIAIAISVFVLSGKWFQPGHNPYETSAIPVETQQVSVEAPAIPVEDWETQIYDAIVEAGFPDPGLMVAIAKAESGLRIDALGDTTITDHVWGPSIGVFQIRTLKTANKGCRDIDALSGDLESQVSCAKQVWDTQGYKAWSAYLNGSYKKFL